MFIIKYVIVTDCQILFSFQVNPLRTYPGQSVPGRYPIPTRFRSEFGIMAAADFQRQLLSLTFHVQLWIISA